MDPDQAKESYEAARGGAEVVVALKPTSGYSVNVLGVVEYRLGLHEEALATLTRSEELRSERYEDGSPLGVAFIAMANLRLQRMAEARAALARLRRLMESREHAESAENRQVLSEAEALFEDLTHPRE
jgi:tetratricopeptide (TPR) repeat protein